MPRPPMNEREAEARYRWWMSMDADEYAFEVYREKDAIGRDGVNATFSQDVTEALYQDIRLFVGTRMMRTWEEEGFAPLRMRVIVRVEFE